VTRSWKTWLPSVLLLLVAGHQRYLVESRGLTPWKGGGMGMYSDFHYRDHEVWLRLDGDGRDPEHEYLSEIERDGLLTLSSRCLRFTGAGCLEELGQAIDELPGGVSRPYTLEVWSFARTEAGFERRLLTELSRP
jgi:hypothetical protein